MAKESERDGAGWGRASLRLRWRDTALWLAVPTLTCLFALPVLRHAATLDTYRYPLGAGGPRVRHHFGLFLLDGLLLVAPSLLAATVARRFRMPILVVVGSILAVTVICEAFVSVATW